MPADDNPKPFPRVLTIAGSDSSCGSGVQADLRVLSRSGVIPCSVVTSVTAQSRDTFFGAHPVPAESIRAQLEAVMRDGVPAATKIGMLSSAEAIEVVCDAIDRWELKNVILDPVLRSTSRGALLGVSPSESGAASGSASLDASVSSSGTESADDSASDLAIIRLKSDLIPRVTLVTPNLDEAGALVGFGARNEEAMRSAAAALVNDLRAPAALVKGGHLPVGKDVFDILQIGDSVSKLTGKAFPGSTPRGTGCILSSSIAIHLARGDDLETSVRKARGFVSVLAEAASSSPDLWQLATGDGFYIRELHGA